MLLALIWTVTAVKPINFHLIWKHFLIIRGCNHRKLQVIDDIAKNDKCFPVSKSSVRETSIKYNA